MRNTPKILSFCLACLATLIFITTISAAPGDLDLTFSQDGKLFDFFHLGVEDIINDTAIQADGKLVAAGSFFFGGVRSCAVSRYNTDGSLDTTFDGDGSAIFPSGRECVLDSVAIQPDGKIVAAGRIVQLLATHDFVVFRYNTNGSLDTSFSSDGIDIFLQTGGEVARGLVIQPDGKIVVAGMTGGSGNDFMLLRYNPDGSLDTSFGTNGRVLSFGMGTLWAVALQTDGKIVAVGQASFPAVVARYNTNGTLDTTFDLDGRVTFDLFSGSPRSVAIQADGKIVVAGYGIINTGTGFPPPQNREMAIARLNADGSMDTSFDLDGKTTTTLPTTDDMAHDVAMQSDGKIVIAGDLESQSSPYIQRFLLARYNTDGSLDGSFNGTGTLVLAPQSSFESVANAVSIQSDGKIVAAGYGEYCCGASEDFAVVRLNTNGTLDPSFSLDGSTHHDVGFTPSSARAVAMQPDGKFVVAGTTINDNFEIGVIRYNADGTLDTSFDADGKTTIDPLPGADEARAVAIQPDGKVLVAGFAGYSSPQPGPMYAVVLRYNANGSLDTTFDSDGKAFVDIGSWDFANAMAVQPDGKIVVAGSFVDTDYTMMLFRLNADGSLDPSFDMDGKVIVPGLATDQAFAVAIQTDGKIVAAGRAHNGSNEDFVVVRLNGDGSLDTSFDFDGAALTPIGSGNDSANAIAIQADGRIVVAGRSRNGANDDFALVRYNPSGSLDTSFDFDGRLTTAIANSGDDEAMAVSIQPNGKITAAGTSNMGNFNGDFSMVRYNTDGSLDGTFSSDGKQTFDFWETSNDLLFGMTLDSAGRAVLVGEASRNVAVTRVLIDFVPRGTPFDFDGDGRADVSVYRPSTGIWYQLFSTGIPYGSPTFGLAGDIPVPSDYDGDGKTDLAIFRPSSGDWWYRASSDGSLRTGHWGAAGDIPLPSDIDNDGKSDFVVYRPSTNVWYRITTIGVQEEFAFGLAGDKPVIGDFDGDGRADHAVFRPSTGDWWYAASSAGRAFRATHWGQDGDIPTPADFDGDGKTDMAVFRPSNGGWYVLKSSDQSYITTAFGLNGDRPVPADYDGDGRADIAVFRPSTGIWYLLQSTSGIAGAQWGLASDVAVPNAFVQP